MNKISIIIPAYNSANYIRETVESVLGQTYPNTELIVVDDGSTDNTFEVIKDYIEKSQVKYIYQANAGVSAARNTGFKATGGEYIAIIDSDDLWHETKLERQLSFMLENNLDMSFTYYEMLKSGNLINMNRKKKKGTSVLDDLLRENIVYASSIMFKRSVLETDGYMDEDLKYGEDWEWCLRIAWKARIAFLPECLTIRKEHADSLSNVTKTRFGSYLKIYKKHSPFCNKEQLKVFKKHIGKKCFIDARRLMRKGLFKLGLFSYIEAVRKQKTLFFKFPSLLKSYLKERTA